jgi:hypothetical protein
VFRAKESTFETRRGIVCAIRSFFLLSEKLNGDFWQMADKGSNPMGHRLKDPKVSAGNYRRIFGWKPWRSDAG